MGRNTLSHLRFQQFREKADHENRLAVFVQEQIKSMPNGRKRARKKHWQASQRAALNEASTISNVRVCGG
jgi:hypothetical protein